ncbi:MAG: bifunctional oligoribonuclease/PAP phosphatase NrnA [Verrucomicrobiae bacterium]|nr:bifunctional oligoribonuclease/PAP phosphatase NrnA [Verrucomicrobiae bacterium]
MSESADPLEDIIKILRGAESVCVAGHVRPDGDCVGSQLGIGLALRAAGKRVHVWNEDPVPRKLAFLDPDGFLTLPEEGHSFDCVVAADCASFERLGRVADCIGNRRTLINIDHHPSNTRYGDVNWIVPDVPSTGELVLDLLKAGSWPVTPAIADCLFTAISTDTGSFRYASTRPETFRAAAELVSAGADLGRIGHRVYDSHPMSRFRLLRHVYRQSRLTHNDRIAYFWLRKGDYGRVGAEREESEGLIDHIRAIEPVIVACVFEEQEDGVVRVSLRSKSDGVDVNAVAQQFGGGGHKAAAGARLTGTRLAVQRKMLRALRQAIDRAARRSP